MLLLGSPGNQEQRATFIPSRDQPGSFGVPPVLTLLPPNKVPLKFSWRNVLWATSQASFPASHKPAQSLTQGESHLVIAEFHRKVTGPSQLSHRGNPTPSSRSPSLLSAGQPPSKDRQHADEGGRESCLSVISEPKAIRAVIPPPLPSSVSLLPDAHWS